MDKGKFLNFSEIVENFNGKKVFITGHTGFKGAWLTRILLKAGANIKGYSHQVLPDSLFFALRLERDIQHNIGDVRDLNQLRKSIDSFSPEYVFHLAAQPLVRYSYDEPLETLSTNILGSANVLEVLRGSVSAKVLIYVTSDKCYENLEWNWGYRENDILGGADPYSASKACAEIIFSSYSRSFMSGRDDFGLSSVRAGNVIGGGDWAKDRIIPDSIRSVINRSGITLRNPMSTRPWQHVLEPLSGYLQLAINMKKCPKDFSGPWNFGPSSANAVTVLEIARYIYKSFGLDENLIKIESSGVHEAALLQLNCDKAAGLLKWSPRWSVTETLDQTIQWYKAFIDAEDLRAVTDNQILTYFGG